MNDPNAPVPGSRPGPDPAAVAAKLTEKRNAEAMSVAQYWGACKEAGATMLAVTDQAIHIKSDKKEIGSMIGSLPFGVAAMAALEAFRGEPATQEKPDKWKSIPYSEPPEEDELPQGGSLTESKTQNGMTEFRTHSSNIKTQTGQPQHRHEAGAQPPGAAGMCIHCKVQPVMHRGSQFCGARCTREHHMKAAAARQGVKL